MPETEVQEVVDPNADLRKQLSERRQLLADVKAAASQAARDQEADSTRKQLEAELAAVTAEIGYEVEAASLVAQANGVEPAPVIAEAGAVVAPEPDPREANGTAVEAEPAKPVPSTPAPPSKPASASASATAANQGE